VKQVVFYEKLYFVIGKHRPLSCEVTQF